MVTTTWPWRAAAAAAVTAAMLAGCTGDEPITGGSTGPPAAASTDAGAVSSDPDTLSVTGLPDPCALFSLDALRSATGVAFGEGTPAPELAAAGELTCLWQPDGEPAPILTVTVSGAAGAPGGVDRAPGHASGQADGTPGADGTWVSGAGDEVRMAVGDLEVRIGYLFYPGDPATVTTAVAILAAAGL